MFTKEELLTLQESLNIVDAEYKKILDKSQGNKSKMVSFNKKQKKLWLLQNKVKKLLDINK